MTLDEFFEKLPRDGWLLDEWKRIRREDDLTCCPQILVRNLLIPERAPLGPFHKTDYNRSWQPIWRAADAGYGGDVHLRARLLEHCGLVEQ